MPGSHHIADERHSTCPIISQSISYISILHSHGGLLNLSCYAIRAGLGSYSLLALELPQLYDLDAWTFPPSRRHLCVHAQQ